MGEALSPIPCTRVTRHPIFNGIGPFFNEMSRCADKYGKGHHRVPFIQQCHFISKLHENCIYTSIMYGRHVFAIRMRNTSN
jgi:hypothetical protein